MDDGDDPVMALLATQRAVLAAVENVDRHRSVTPRQTELTR